MSRSFLSSIAFALCAALLPSCGSPTGMVASDPATFNALMRIAPPADHPDAEAVVITDEGTMEIFGGGEAGFSLFDRHRTVKVFNPRGHRYANIIIPYSTGSQITGIAARTITPSGRSVELNEADIFDVSLYPNFVFFSDQRAKIFTFPAVEDGAVLEYSYRLRLSRGLWHGWNFQDEIPVLHSRFMLVKPGEWKIHYRGYKNIAEPAYTPAPAGFKSKHLWEERHVPPLTAEFGMPPAQEVLKHLAIAPIGFDTWNDVSSWYYEIVHPKCSGGPLVQALADNIEAAHPDSLDRLRAIFTWVRDHVRYIAVEIGVGGYTPHDAEDILAKRYGDCKDMVVLVCALAARMDLRVTPMLTSTRQNGRVDTSLASPLQFNHVIAWAPDIAGGIWMDATEKACGFGVLPWYDQGVDVVAAMNRPEKVLVRTPASPPASNRMHLRWHAVADSAGGAVISGASILTGTIAAETRHQLRSASRADQRAWLESFLAGRVAVPDIDSIAVHGTSPEEDSLVVAYTMSTRGFASRHGTSLIFRPGEILNNDLPGLFRSPLRIHPVNFRFGSSTSLDLTVTFPPGWKSGPAGEPDVIRSECGEWYQRHTIVDAQMRFECGYTLNGEQIPAERYHVFRRFLDGTQIAGRSTIVLTRTR